MVPSNRFDALADDGPPRLPAAGALEPLFAGRELADAMDEALAWIAAIRRLLVAKVHALAAAAEDAGVGVLRLIDACDALSRVARAIVRGGLCQRCRLQLGPRRCMT